MTYKIKATMIWASLTNAFLQGIHVFLGIPVMRNLGKANGDAVTIGDIISGDYISTPLGGKTPN